MTEHEIAIMEGNMIRANDEYFSARPELDNDQNRKTFQAGFERAWKMQKFQIQVEVK